MRRSTHHAVEGTCMGNRWKRRDREQRSAAALLATCDTFADTHLVVAYQRSRRAWVRSHRVSTDGVPTWNRGGAGRWATRRRPGDLHEKLR